MSQALAKRMLRRPSATIVEIDEFQASGGSSTPAWSWLSDRTASMVKDSSKEEDALNYCIKRGVSDMCVAQIDLGLSMARQGKHRYEDAIGALQRAVEEDPLSVKATRLLAWLLGEQRRYPEAESTIRRALELDGEDATLWLMLGSCLRMLNQHDEAVAALRTCLQKDAGQDRCLSAWRILGFSLHEIRQEEEAENAFRRAIAIEPSDSQAHYGLGLVLGSRGAQAVGKRALRCALDTEAEAELRTAVELDSANAEAWSYLGVILQLQHKPEESEAAFRRALHIHPESAAALYGLALALRAQDKNYESQRMLREALALEPELHPRAQYDLACAWRPLRDHYPYDVVRGAEKEAALQACIRLDPGHAAARTQYGNYLKNAGRYDEARPVLEEAVRLQAGHPAATFNLEGVLNALGEPGRAADRHEDLCRRMQAEHGVLGGRWRRVDGPGGLHGFLKKALEVDGLGL